MTMVICSIACCASYGRKRMNEGIVVLFRVPCKTSPAKRSSKVATHHRKSSEVKNAQNDAWVNVIKLGHRNERFLSMQMLVKINFHVKSSQHRRTRICFYHKLTLDAIWPSVSCDWPVSLDVSMSTGLISEFEIQIKY